MKRMLLFTLGFCLFSLLSIHPASAQVNESNISGRVITGFRVLQIAPDAMKVDFTVYRGDYIKFQYGADSGSLLFAMPTLKYKGTVQPDPVKSPYFKMKAAGGYPFSLGPISGTIKVVELVRPNYMELTAPQAIEILDNLKPFILDVRTPGEYRAIHIKDSTLIPISQLQARAGELDSRKNNDVFVYCATGNRSTVAARILANRGFKRIYNLRYGVHDWARKGYPVIRQ